MNYGFVIDNRKCIGCHACTVACKSEHNVPVGVNRTHVKYVEKGTFPNTSRTFTVTRCNHCEDAPCAEICPTSALFTRRDGIVDFDGDRCIACKSCMQACPYDALYIDPATQTAAKCNYCAHRIENSYEPACVIVCPVEAIVCGDLDDPLSGISQLVSREQVSVRKAGKGTKPNVYYVEGDYAALNPQHATPMDDYIASHQATGVGHFADYMEDRLSKAANDALFLPVVESPQAQQGGVTLAGGISVSQRAIDDVGRELKAEVGASRRVYDVPGKGVLWGWQVPSYILTKAIASGTFIVMMILQLMGDQLSSSTQFWAMGTSLAFLALTGALLVHDLDRPERFLYVLLRPNWKSWLVRGAYIITGFGGGVSIMLLCVWLGWGALGGLLSWPTLVLALLAAIYTAFLFAQAKGRDLWQSPISSIRMLNHAGICGGVVMLFIEPSLLPTLAKFLAAGLGLNIAVLLLEIWTPHPSADSSKAIQLMTRGSLGFYFFTSLLIGSILPFLVFLFGGSLLLSSTAAVIAIIGIFATEYVWVRGPQLVPLA